MSKDAAGRWGGHVEQQPAEDLPAGVGAAGGDGREVGREDDWGLREESRGETLAVGCVPGTVDWGHVAVGALHLPPAQPQAPQGGGAQVQLVL